MSRWEGGTQVVSSLVRCSKTMYEFNIGVNVVLRKKSSCNQSRTRSTPHTNLNVMLWHFMDTLGIFLQTVNFYSKISRIHLEKVVSSPDRTDMGSYFCSIHAMNLPVHKIHALRSCLKVCESLFPCMDSAVFFCPR